MLGGVPFGSSQIVSAIDIVDLTRRYQGEEAGNGWFARIKPFQIPKGGSCPRPRAGLLPIPFVVAPFTLAMHLAKTSGIAAAVVSFRHCDGVDASSTADAK